MNLVRLSKSTRFGHCFVPVLVAAALIGGCGDDDGSKHPSYAGQYAGSALVSATQRANVGLDVATDGSTSGQLSIVAARASKRAALPGLPVGLLGTTDPATGAYDVRGSYPDGSGGSVSVRVTGILPTPSAAGTMTIQIGDQSFSGAFTPPPTTATRTQAPATATRTSASTHTPGGPTRTPTPSPSPSHTPGETASPTPTTGGLPGVDARFFGTWAGTARNESTGVQKSVRLRVAAQSGSVAVTDLGGNLFKVGGSTVTMTAPSASSLVYTSTAGQIVAFNLTLAPNDGLAGLYQVTTPALPPVIDAVALVLSRES